MDNNKIFTERNCQISIDTMELTAKLTYKELDELQSYFDFDKSSQSEALRHYEAVYHLKQYGFTMKVLPRIKQWRQHYNIRITLQTAFFEVERVPAVLIDLIHRFNWSVTYLHIAFDYPSIYRPLVFKHHHKLAYERLIDEHGHVSEYFGSRGTKRKIDCEDFVGDIWLYRKNNIAILYDRNEKELSRGMVESSRHKYSKRYEARIKFKIGEFTMSKPAHEKVAQDLDKRILIADLESTAIHEYMKRPLRTLQQSFDNEKHLNAKWKRDDKKARRERKKLLDAVRTNKEPLADMYLEHCQELFSVFERVNMVDSLYELVV